MVKRTPPPELPETMVDEAAAAIFARAFDRRPEAFWSASDYQRTLCRDLAIAALATVSPRLGEPAIPFVAHK